MTKVTLITGASGGLGLEFARLFAKDGHNLALIARNAENLSAIKHELESAHNISVFIYPCDLSRENAAQSVFEWSKAQNLQVESLLNNAGFGAFGEFIEIPLTRQSEMIALNITALTQLTHFFANDMLKNGGGTIINTCSIAAFQAGALMAVYYATKAFVLSFSEALFVELKPRGIAVIALCPGPVRTNFESAASLGKSGLFKRLKVANAVDVAKYAYNARHSGKTILIYGLSNKLIVLASKLAPRAVTRNVVRWIQR